MKLENKTKISLLKFFDNLWKFYSYYKSNKIYQIKPKIKSYQTITVILILKFKIL